MAGTGGRFQALRSIDRRVLDAVVAAVLLASVLVDLATRRPSYPGQRPTDVFAYLLAVALAAPYAVHRYRPLAAILCADAALVTYGVLRYAAYPAVPVFVLLAAVSLHAERRRVAIAAAASAVALSVAVWRQPPGVADASTWVASLLALAVAWLWGQSVRDRRARFAALEERARLLEAEREEQARKAVTQERLRIARELHDVVAHSMSVIAVQSGMANHVIDSRPREARRALATIEATTRAALVEMRRLLGVLRQEDDPVASLTPVAGLADAPDLARQMGEAGLRVEIGVEGTGTGVPPGVDLSAYRIVQEALTNVLRHGGPVARVVIRYEPGMVAVEVSDDGRGPGARPGPPGSGHGLIGMRERVAVFGGDLRAGTVPGGGYRLNARLPYTPAAS